MGDDEDDDDDDDEDDDDDDDDDDEDDDDGDDEDDDVKYNEEYNYNISDVQEFNDAFVTPIVEIDDEDLPDYDDDDRRRILVKLQTSADDTSGSIVYSDVEGTSFVADDDSFEYGVNVDDIAFSESICVPGSSDCDGKSGLEWWAWGLIVIGAILLIFAIVHFVGKKSGDKNSQESGEYYGQSSANEKLVTSQRQNNASELVQNS